MWAPYCKNTLPHLGLTTVECVFGWWGGEGGRVPIHQSTVCVGDHSLVGGCGVEWWEVCPLCSSGVV